MTTFCLLHCLLTSFHVVTEDLNIVNWRAYTKQNIVETAREHFSSHVSLALQYLCSLSFSVEQKLLLNLVIVSVVEAFFSGNNNKLCSDSGNNNKLQWFFELLEIRFSVFTEIGEIADRGITFWTVLKVCYQVTELLSVICHKWNSNFLDGVGVSWK